MLCPYDTFIAGETIDLVVPNQSAVDEGRWHKWFNDPETTRYIDQGRFPNTIEEQRKYLAAAQGPKSNRLVLLIWAKDVGKLVGVTSLSDINMVCRSAQNAIIIGEKTGTIGGLFYGLETRALIAEHGFEVMGLERIYGSLAASHDDWQKYQMLFGFRLEAFLRASFRKGYKSEDAVSIACLLDDYLEIKKLRGGDYWPGKQRLMELIRAMPEGSPINLFRDAIDSAMDNYLSKITWA